MGMKITYVLFSAILLTLNGQGSSALFPANEYMDIVLNSALQFEARVLNIDPLHLIDFQTSFEDRIKVIGKVKGYVNYTDGQLTGLSQPLRSTDCQGPVYGFGFKYLNCTISLNNLQITYNGRLKYGKFTPSIAIKAKANMRPINVFVEIVQYQASPTPVLRSFRFLQIGLMDTKFTGLGPVFSQQPTILDGAFRNYVWPTFFQSVAEGFQLLLSRSVALVSLPDV